MAGGATDPQGGNVLPWHWPRGGDVECSGRNFKYSDHILHHLPRLSPWVYGGSWHRYRHPRDQTASAVSRLGGGGTVRDISGPIQGV